MINPDEGSPAFIHIEEITLSTEAGEGTPSQNFTDAWVYADGQYIGTFELPGTFPILNSGLTKIQIFAGVKDNGFSSSRVQYGFLSPFTINVDLVPEETIELAPQVNYLPNILNFSLIDFEDASFQINAADGSDTTVVRVDNPDPLITVLEDKVGAVYLDEDHDFFRIETELFLPLSGVNFCYLELDYKNNTRFFMGLMQSGSAFNEVSLIGMNPSLDENGQSEWNKIYIDLSDAIDFLGNPLQFDLFFQGGIESGEAEVLIDNIKVVYTN